jgi:hypothetical protein
LKGDGGVAEKETPFRGIFKVLEAVLAYAQKSLHIGIFENARFGWLAGVYKVPHTETVEL